MRRYFGRRSLTWWLVWFTGAVCLVAGQRLGRPNAVHGLGVLVIWGLIAYEAARLAVDVWRLVTRAPWWRRLTCDHRWHPADPMILWRCGRCDSDRDGMPADGPGLIGCLVRWWRRSYQGTVRR